jgi:hypothetical protein
MEAGREMSGRNELSGGQGATKVGILDMDMKFGCAATRHGIFLAKLFLDVVDVV